MQVLEPTTKVEAEDGVRSIRARQLGIHAHLDDPRWLLARRIADSGGLGRSRLLADFLLFIVDRHIRDRTDEITEQQIGILVFGRAEGYDASDDNIVRSYARTLRRRIEEYFATEGASEPLRLEIPRGGYAPAFSSRPVETEPSTEARSIPQTTSPLSDDKSIGSGTGSMPAESRPSQASEVVGPSSTSAKAAEARVTLHKYGAVLTLCVGIVLGLVVAAFHPMNFLKRATAPPPEAASAALWSELFGSDRDTFIVPSDGGLVIMQRLIDRPLPLANYINASYRAKAEADAAPGAPEILKLGARRFTSVVDLDFVAHIAQLDEVVPTRMVIRYARDLRIDELRTGNAILIGSVEANPWIELFQPQMNFRFEINAGNDKPSGIRNVHPRPGESMIYGTGPDHTYGLIAYRPNLTSTGHVLIVGGLNTAGTEAATTFLLTPSLMMQVLQRAKSAHGGLQPFELLVDAGSVATNASSPKAVLERVETP